MVNKITSIPQNMTIEEASEFWDAHSIADYPSHKLELEYAADERITFVAIARDLLNKVKEQAKNSGVSVETLVNLWIQEKIAR